MVCGHTEKSSLGLVLCLPEKSNLPCCAKSGYILSPFPLTQLAQTNFLGSRVYIPKVQAM